MSFGKARLVREGTDVTIVAWSRMAVEAEAAAAALEEEGIRAEVIDPRTLAPLDIGALADSARKTGRVLIVEEAPGTGGVSAEIGMQLVERVYDYLDAPIRRLAASDVPVPASPVLEKALLPDRQRIFEEAVALVRQ